METNKTISLKEKKTMKRPTNAKMRITKKVMSQITRMKNKWIITCNSIRNFFWPLISQHSEDNRCSREFRRTTIRSTKKITETEPPISRDRVDQVKPRMEVSRMPKQGLISRTMKLMSHKRVLHFCRAHESTCTEIWLWMVTKEQICQQQRPLEATQEELLE